MVVCLLVTVEWCDGVLVDCWLVECWLLVVGCWLLVACCWLLLAVGYCWLLIVCWLVVGCWLLCLGWLLVVGCCLLIVSCWCCLLVVGDDVCWLVEHWSHVVCCWRGAGGRRGDSAIKKANGIRVHCNLFSYRRVQ